MSWEHLIRWIYFFFEQEGFGTIYSLHEVFCMSFVLIREIASNNCVATFRWFNLIDLQVLYKLERL